jgi:hypothetical protein
VYNVTCAHAIEIFNVKGLHPSDCLGKLADHLTAADTPYGRWTCVRTNGRVIEYGIDYDRWGTHFTANSIP